MKILRIEAYQETACYRKPFSNKVTETYPLPPYSTVKGMIHALLDASELIPFSLSVQGHYESMLVDYKKTYFIKKRQFAMPIVTEGLAMEIPEFDSKTMSSMPLYTHLLYNVQLVIHVKAEEEIMEKIYESFQGTSNFISLGRYEDILRIDEVAWTTVREATSCKLTYGTYIPERLIADDEKGLGVPYLLNWTYKIKQGIREWERIPVLYVEGNQRIFEDHMVGEVLQMDDKDYPIFWNV